MAHFAGTDFLDADMAVADGDEFDRGDLTCRNRRERLAVEMSAVLVGSGKHEVEIGEEGGSEADLTGVEEGDGNAPEGLTEGEVACAVNWIEEPEPFVGGW